MNSKPQGVSSQKFICLLSLYFTFVLNINFWHFILTKLEISNFSTFFFALSLPIFMFVPLFLFFSLLVWPKIGKPIVAVLLVLSAAADYATCNLGIVIDSDMVRNFAETNLREGLDFVTLRAVMYVIFVGVIPAVIVLRTKINFAPAWSEIKRRLLNNLILLLVFVISTGSCYKEYVSFGRNNPQLRRCVNTFNYIYAVGRYHQKQRLRNRTFTILDATPQKELSKSGKPRILVLIVGETARAQNFSLYGYERETNPLLAKQDIIAFQDVTSCGTATAISLPCMFAATPQSGFDVTDAKFTQNLMDIAQLAGYDIWWKDNDDGCKEVCKRVPTVDAKSGNKAPFCFGDYCHDDILLDDLDERLRQVKADSVIVLHAMGSHGPTYFKRYPDKFKRFTPACDTADLQDCSRKQIINTYDNTILYTDYVISTAIDILRKHKNLESSLLYISDHGESLGENNIYLHGLPYKIAPDEQKKVPMIMWLSDSWQKANRLDKACLQKQSQTESYSHDNLYSSVLHLLGIKSSTYNQQFDLFTPCIKK